LLPLHLAAAKGHSGCVELLLTLEIIDERDEDGCTPLWRACVNGHEHIVEFLIEQGADCGSANFDGNMPLHIAASFGNYTIIERLLNEGCDSSAQNKYGQTP
ncbi:ankyrin repeat-containing domain protein, partial [Colletotrichum godetiae]